MAREIPAYYGGNATREQVLGYGGQSITDAEKDAVLDALEQDHITRGPIVEEFEAAVADLVDVNHAIATTSGTAALHLAGRAAGFNLGDEVITTPLTFVSTAHAATYSRAVPVLADIEPRRRTLDPNAVRQYLNESTAGLVPMHYAGHPADIEELLTVADEEDLTVIWDASHAFGGNWRDEPIGAQRDMAVFSFHPVKTITTAEGGMIVTDDDEIADRLRRLRSFDMEYEPPSHGDEPWYQVVKGVGYNYNFTDIQAALGLAQLERLDQFKNRRSEIINRYNDVFESIKGILTPPKTDDADPCYHLYVVEIRDEFGCSRKEFVNAMHAENIGVQVHYVPLHLHPFFQDEYGYEVGDFPVAEQIYEGIVSLPLYPEMSDEDVNDVIRSVSRLHAYLTN